MIKTVDLEWADWNDDVGKSFREAGERALQDNKKSAREFDSALNKAKSYHYGEDRYQSKKMQIQSLEIKG